MNWELLKTTDYEEAIHFAKSHGWKDRNVQVRVEFVDYIAHYYVEPFERDCSCPHILKYSKHFPDPT